MMNKKYLLLIFIFTCTLLTISIVSAAENNTNTTTSISVNESETISATTPTYTTLYNEIKNTSERSELILTKDYTYYRNYDDKTFEDDKYITINKTITINGKGHTINGNNIAGGFNIPYETQNVILKNIIFKNCYNEKQGHRILDISEGNIIQNCTFINCHGSDRASGIISISGNSNGILNCKFINCYNNIYFTISTVSTETLNGGIIYTSGGYNKISNCDFINCYTNYTNYNKGKYDLKGNIICLIMDHNYIEKCRFENSQVYKTNTAQVNKYGDIYIDSWESNITDCTFDNSYNTGYGVFIYNNAAKVNIKGCTFKNSESASVYVKGNDCTLSNSKFISCQYYATRWTGNNGIMTNCTFTNCNFNEGDNYWTGSNGQYIDPNKPSEPENNNTLVEPENTNNNTNSTEPPKNNTTSSTQNNTVTQPKTNTNINTKVVKKSTPKITAKEKTYKAKTKNKKYTVKITINNKPLKKATLTLKLNGKTYKAKTNTKGIATFKLKISKKGKHPVTIQFKSTKKYNSKRIKTSITIK